MYLKMKISEDRNENERMREERERNERGKEMKSSEELVLIVSRKMGLVRLQEIV